MQYTPRRRVSRALAGYAQLAAAAWDEARATVARALEIATEHRTFLQVIPDLSVYEAWSWLGSGNPEQALASVQRAFDEVRGIDSDIRHPLPLAFIVRAAALGRLESQAPEGIAAAFDEAESQLRAAEARGWLTELYRARAEWLGRRGDAAGRRGELQRARALCVEIGAAGWISRLDDALEE